jgi:biopolymer transport protein ExbD
MGTVTEQQLAEGIEEGVFEETDLVIGPGESTWTAIGEHPRLADLVPFRFPRASHQLEEMESDLTPMIDVTLQLVIFFMIAATFTVQKTLDLPQSKPDEEAASTVTMEELEQESIVVEISADGSILVQNEPVKLDDLPNALQQAVRDRSTAELVLDVDDDVVHDVVVRVLDAAGAAQIERVMFVSRSGPDAGASGASE